MNKLAGGDPDEINDMLTYLEIDSAAFMANIAQLKKHTGPQALAIVVKSNAYGHGIVEIASLLEQVSDVAFLCCASLSEALRLRRAGIKKLILVCGIIDDCLSKADENIEFIVADNDMAHELHQAGHLYHRIFRIHIKIDTGLSRLGIAPEFLVETIHELQQLSHIIITGLCTHFAQAHEQDAHTKLQVARFFQVVTIGKKNIPSLRWIHAANSAATLLVPLPWCNVVRVGLSAYGYWPCHDTKKLLAEQHKNIELTPLLTWKTHIMAVKQIPADVPIGYKGTFKTARPTRLGIIPVGYFDGYDFRFSNRSYVRVENQLAPVVGRICMNFCMIDITDIPTATRGTLVMLLNPKELDATVLTQLLCQDNVRIFLTALGTHIPRIVV